MTTQIRATAAAIVPIVARLIGARRESFTATSATATTVVAPDGGVRSETDDAYNDLYLYVVSGTGVGQTRLVRDYTGATRTFTVDNWITNPDSTSVILVLSANPAEIFDFIGDAIRSATQQLYPPFADSSLKYGNILVNEHFQYWDSGSTVATGAFIFTRWLSDGWTVGGTGAVGSRESVIARNLNGLDTYSGEMVTDGTNEGYFQQLVTQWARYANERFDFEVWAYASVASRVRGRLVTGTQTLLTDAGGASGDHTATAGWERLERLDVQVDDQLTQLAFQAYVVSGSAQTVRFDDAGFYPRSRVELYRPPPWMTHIKDIYVERNRPTIGTDGLPDQESSGIGEFWPTPISRDDWRIIRREGDGEPYLWISRLSSIPWKHHLLLQGAGYRTDTIAAATNIEFDPQLIAHMASAKLYRPGGTREGLVRLSDLQREADRLILISPWRHAPPGSRRLRG